MSNTDSNIHQTTFPHIWDIVAIIILFFMGQGVPGLILALSGMVDLSSAPDAADIEEFMNWNIQRGNTMAVIYPVTMILTIALIVGYMYLRGYRSFRTRWSPRGLDPFITVKGIVWIIALQIVLEPLTTLLPELESELGRGGWACFTAVIAAPILEELLCRGLLLDALCTRYRALTAVVISAAIFGVMHVSPATAFSAFAVGLILGIIYLSTQSLLSTIILHAINNAVAFTLLCLGMKDLTFSEMTGGGATYFILYAVATAITISMFYYAWNTVLKRR